MTVQSLQTAFFDSAFVTITLHDVRVVAISSLFSEVRPIATAHPEVPAPTLH